MLTSHEPLQNSETYVIKSVPLLIEKISFDAYFICLRRIHF